MRRFQITGRFDAEDIDDAFARLAAHFTVLATGGETVFGPGFEMTIQPVEYDE